VEQVLSEGVAGDRLREGEVRGCDDPDVYLDGTRTPDGQDLALLQRPKELDLGGLRQLTHLVEEDRTAIGLPEVARASRGSPREGTFFVAEELGLDELRRDRAAVHGDERSVAARARTMDRAGQELLAGPRFPFDQEGHGSGGDASSPQDQALHRASAVDDRVELGRIRWEAGAQSFQLAIRAPKEVG